MTKTIIYLLTTFGSLALFLYGENNGIGGLVNIAVFYFWLTSLVSMACFSDKVVEEIITSDDGVRVNKIVVGLGIVLTIVALLYYNWFITAIAMTLRGIAVAYFNTKIDELMSKTNREV